MEQRLLRLQVQRHIRVCHLQFANHAAGYTESIARFAYPWGERQPGQPCAGRGRGLRARRELDTGGNLYHIMPLHGTLPGASPRRMVQRLEFQAVDAKTDVEAVRNELPTPGYALLNIRSGISGSCSKEPVCAPMRASTNLTAGNTRCPGRRYWVAIPRKHFRAGHGPVHLYGLTFQF